MIEVKYYKDYRHNYLILKDNGCLSENVYQRKMVSENKIKGLLDSQERFINGEILLYYEITSKQSLSSVYDGRSMGMEQIQKFFIQLKVVSDILQKYLLDESCLILQPEYIFQDIATGEYFFLYYPDPEEGSLSQLMDFFISRVDSADLEAVEVIYKIADLINREQFVLDEVLKWFQDDAAGGEKNRNKVENSGGAILRQKDECLKDFRDLQDENIDKASIESKKDKDRTYEIHKRSLSKVIPLWVSGVLAAGVLCYIMYFYELSYIQEIYLIAGWILAAAFILVPAAWYFYPQISKTGKKVESKDIDNVAEESLYCHGADYGNDVAEASEKYNNTVYIPWTENCENKLYSMDKKTKCHIDLGNLPITVGKLAGAVDMVINEQSMSRMHAKFSRTGSNVCITDLNSTNGTFRNGIRLAPNASEIIEPGDEIRLGKLKFIYR